MKTKEKRGDEAGRGASDETTKRRNDENVVKTGRWADWAAWGALAAAAGLRVAGAWGARAVTDMDTSVVALMARHMAHGTEWPVFFYGQAYMGSLEPAGSALVMRLFGDGGFALAMGTVLWGLAAMWVLWRWARDAAGAAGGAVAVALAAAGPLVWFQFQVAARGGYMVAVLVDALVLWGAGRLAADWWAGKGGGAWRAAAMGLAAGVGVWSDPIVVPALAAAVAVLLAGMRGRVWKHKGAVAAGVAGTAVGASPWWIWWMVHGGDLLALPASARSPLRRAVELTWNRWLLFQGEGMPTRACAALGVASLALAALGVAAWARGAKKAGARANFATLGAVLFLGAFAAAFVLSGFNQAHTGRYWVPAWPAVALLAGWACAGGRRTQRVASRPERAARVAAWGVAGVLGAVQLGIVLYHVRATVERAPEELARIGELRGAVLGTGADAFLTSRREYPLNFAWGEAVPVSDGLLEFYGPIRLAAELAENPAYAKSWMGVSAMFGRIGAEAETAGGRHLRFNVRGPVPREAVAWAFGTVAAPSAELRWEGTEALSGVGFWMHDFRGLRQARMDVDVLEGGEWRRVYAGEEATAASWSGTRAYPEAEPFLLADNFGLPVEDVRGNFGGGTYQEFRLESGAAEGVRVTLRGLPEGTEQAMDIVAYGTREAGPGAAEGGGELLDAIADAAGEDAAVFAPRWLSNRLYRAGRIPAERLRGLSARVFGMCGDERERWAWEVPAVVAVERRHDGMLREALSRAGVAAEAVETGTEGWRAYRVEAGGPGREARWTGRWMSPGGGGRE